MSLVKSRAEILALLVTTNDYKAYQRACGADIAEEVSKLLIDEELKCQDGNGRYSPGKNSLERARVRLTEQSVFKLKDNKMLTELLNRLAITLGGEVSKLNPRMQKLANLYAKVAQGRLAQEMQQPGRIQPEESYYTAPVPAPEKVERIKALSWLKHGVRGSTAAYDDLFKKLIKAGSGPFPGTDERTLVAIWDALVTDEPPYRLPSPEALYPASFTGLHGLAHLLRTNGGAAMPPIGMNPNVWQSYALYWFAAVVSLQPFSNGNKRVARAVYAILMTRAGIPFVAPSNAYGTQLAGM